MMMMMMMRKTMMPETFGTSFSAVLSDARSFFRGSYADSISQNSVIISIAMFGSDDAIAPRRGNAF